MRNLARYTCLLALMIFAAAAASSQEIGGTIRGTLLDPAGRTVSGAQVTITQTETGLTRTVTSDSQGAYVLVELPVGRYRLEVEAKGFQKYLQEGISLDNFLIDGASNFNAVDGGLVMTVGGPRAALNADACGRITASETRG